MASTKNSNRSKRKYGDKRKSVTESNRAKRSSKDGVRTARLVDRTQALIGQRARVRTKEGPELGTIEAITDRPEGAKRRGQYLHILTPTGQFTRARSRAKIVRPLKGD